MQPAETNLSALQPGRFMELNDQLQELLSEISPTDAQQSALRDAHIRLRERLMADDDLKPWIVETFLQGSYRRHTGIRPERATNPTSTRWWSPAWTAASTPRNRR